MQNTNYTALSSAENGNVAAANEAILPASSNQEDNGRKRIISFLITGSLVLLSATLLIMIGIGHYHQWKNSKIPFVFKNLSLDTKFIQSDQGYKVLDLTLGCDLTLLDNGIIMGKKEERAIESIDANMEYKKIGHLRSSYHRSNGHIDAFKLKTGEVKKIKFYLAKGLNGKDEWEENCRKTGKSDMRLNVILKAPKLEYTVVVPFVLDCHELKSL